MDIFQALSSGHHKRAHITLTPATLQYSCLLALILYTDISLYFEISFRDCVCPHMIQTIHEDPVLQAQCSQQENMCKAVYWFYDLKISKATTVHTTLLKYFIVINISLIISFLGG